MKYDMSKVEASVHIEMYPATDGTGDTLINTQMIGTPENIALIFVRMMEKYPVVVPVIEAALKNYKMPKR